MRIKRWETSVGSTRSVAMASCISTQMNEVVSGGPGSQVRGTGCSVMSVLNKRMCVAPWEQKKNVIELITFHSPEIGLRALRVAPAQRGFAVSLAGKTRARGALRSDQRPSPRKRRSCSEDPGAGPRPRSVLSGWFVSEARRCPVSGY